MLHRLMGGGSDLAADLWRENYRIMVSDFPPMAVEVMGVLAHRLEHTNALLRECQDKLATGRP